ncbi:transcriptional regulator [Paenibacillus alvei TS-15]|uniref:Transcriptional regulator n=1 Tax=Paenibacillus alvei TS-15 TaxID=1117108 RepID=S9SUG7_PAEAL|nr:helix-turn-helix domain-containing protein [Paenibacillus alvei]EPY07798.1 transcriptional regulator [Paenibacillus alvei TS-15]
MKQKQMMTLVHYDQLKQLSDPLRCRIVSLLIPKSYTGQQLSQELEIPRAKIHYHLNELEKHELIAVAKTEVKNGIIQKFYRSAAKSFIPATHLLPHGEEVGDYYRELTVHTLERARLRAISAPERAFQLEASDWDSISRLSVQVQIWSTKEKILAWRKKYRALLEELDQFDEPEETEGNWYYLMTTGFEIDEPWFDDSDLEPEIGLGEPHARANENANVNSNVNTNANEEGTGKQSAMGNQGEG